MNNIKKIIFFIGYAVGDGKNRCVCGPEIRYLEVCKRIYPGKIKPIVIYPYCASLFDDFKKLEGMNKIELIAYEPKTRFDYFKILYRVLKKSRADVVHCQGPHLFDAIAVFLGKIFSAKIIITRPVNISQDHLSSIKQKLFYLSDQLIVKRADFLVAISKTHKTIWSKELYKRDNVLINKKMKIIYNGINLNKFSRKRFQISNKRVIFSIIAQLTSIKGHDLLFKAGKRLLDEGHDFKILVVGDGPLRHSHESLCKKLNMDQVIEFCGFIKNVEEILSKTHVVILPSLREGLSLALLEGMAMGCPLIASDVGASNELVINGKNGFLIKKNSINDIYDKMKLFIKNPDLISKMGMISKNASQKYDIRKMTEEYLKLYLN